MALEVGDPVRGTGLAGAIAAARRKAFPKTYNPAKDPLVKLEAEAIINYLKGNMEVHVTVDTGTGEGQVDDDGVTVSTITGDGSINDPGVTVDTGTGEGTGTIT